MPNKVSSNLAAQLSVLLICKTFSVRAINVVSSAYLGERQLSREVLPSLGGHRDQA